MAKVNLQVESTPAPASPGFVELFVDSADGLAKQVDEHGVVKAFAIVQSRTVHIPSAEILTLGSTPIELVPAPASGSMILVTNAFVSLSGVTTPYATNTTLDALYGASGTRAFESSDFLAETAASVSSTDFNVFGGGSPVPVADVDGAALNLLVFTGDPTDGDGNLSVTVTYQVIALA